jgi:glutamyl-tRNA reductase
MQIVVVGLNHKTAPVEVRERVSLSGCALRLALQEIPPVSHGPEHPPIYGGVILSTCNRFEVYTLAPSAREAKAAVVDFVARVQGVQAEDLVPYLYVMEDGDAIMHLFRVASGLDSQVIGEPQILGQVAAAYEEARDQDRVGARLSMLFQRAIHVGKRVRSDTVISRRPVSVSHVAVERLRSDLGGFAGKRVLLLGAGEMAELTLKVLTNRRTKPNVVVVNRTFQRARRLAEAYGCHAAPWDRLRTEIAVSDAMLCATGAPHVVVTAAMLADALAMRRDGKPLVVVDIAVPRDVEEEAASLPRIAYTDIDGLKSIIGENLKVREQAISEAEKIIAGEFDEFVRHLTARSVVPVIRAMRERAEEIRAAEVKRAAPKLSGLSERERRAVEAMSRAIVNKLLHTPIVRLKEHAQEGDGMRYAEALFDLCDLETEMMGEVGG